MTPTMKTRDSHESTEEERERDGEEDPTASRWRDASHGALKIAREDAAGVKNVTRDVTPVNQNGTCAPECVSGARAVHRDELEGILWRLA